MVKFKITDANRISRVCQELVEESYEDPFLFLGRTIEEIYIPST